MSRFWCFASYYCRTLSPAIVAVVAGICVTPQTVTAQSRLPRPGHDESSVVIMRLVVVESAAPLLSHGAQMSESVLAERLEQWERSGSGRVALDTGFLMPEQEETLDPLPDRGGGREVVLQGRRLRTPGPAIRLRTQSRPDGSHWFGVGMNVWSMPQRSLRQSLAAIQMASQDVSARAASSIASPGVAYAWESPDLLATAVMCPGGEGASAYYLVIFMPIASRGPLVANAEQPRRFSSASLQLVHGRVPTEALWSIISGVRPDVGRPSETGSAVLNMFWTDEKWEVFRAAMSQAGARWARPEERVLVPEAPSMKFSPEGVVVTATLNQPLPASAFTLRVEGPPDASGADAAILLRGGGPVTVDELCESHHQRWTLLARADGSETTLVALRTEFSEDTPAPKAVPLTIVPTTTGPALPMLPPPAAPSLTPTSPTVRKAELSGMEALGLYEGEWDGTVTGMPKARMKFLGTWGARRLEMRRESRVEMEPGVTPPIFTATVMRYEELTGRYRSEMMMAASTTPSYADGVWDPATRSFVWTATDKLSGAKMITTATFPKDGVCDWTQVTTDAQGRVIGKGGGRFLRK